MRGSRLLLAILLVCLPGVLFGTCSLSQALQANPEIISVGVLAKRGKPNCFEQWQSTIGYLEKVTGFSVQLLCLDFAEVPAMVMEKKVDFTITNPSMYVDLEYRYGATRIATLKNKRSSNSYTQFGGVIFSKAERDDLQTIKDLQGKRFMAVDKESFGGWQVSWRYLLEHGVNPHRDFKQLLYGGRHDAVVYAVFNGVVDAGAVRTDTLERLQAEGKIDIDDFKVFSNVSKKDTSFPFLLTTRLYPEWPFAKMKHTKEELAKQIGIALLKMKPESRAAIHSKSMGWTIPLDYYPVHECLQFLKIGPYKYLATVTLKQFYAQYKNWIFVAVAFLLFLSGVVSYVLLLNKRLHSAMIQLDYDHMERKQIVADLNEFKLTLDHIHDCVFMFGPDTLSFIYVNNGAIAQIGYTYEELIKMTPVDIKPEFTEPDFRAILKPLLRKPEQAYTFTTTHLAKDGSLIPVEVLLQYVIPSGKEGRFVAIVRDITDRLREQQEKELLQVKLLSEQKLASVGQLAAGIAHEINTPIQYVSSNIAFFQESFADIMTFIDSFESFLKAGEKLPALSKEVQVVAEVREEIDWEYLMEEIPSAIDQSLDGVNKVSSIVLAMKAFSHPGSSEKEQTDLNKLLETTVTVARNEWKYVADISMQLDENLPTVLCMHNEIGQVFLNILINAAHAIGERLSKESTESKGKITIISKQLEKQAEIKIIDTGCGIPDEIKDLVFDPFFTTKEVGKGTGQGLAIVHDIILNKHKGTLNVESETGAGTTFIIRLPYSAVAKL